MFVIDLSNPLTKKHDPIRNVRIGPGSTTLAATLGAAYTATEAVWWHLADNKPIGRSSIFPPAWSKYCYTNSFVEPVFTPDLTRCAVHGYAPGSGSVEFHSVVIVAPGESYKQGADFSFPEDYCEDSLEALAISPDGQWLLAGHRLGRLSRLDLTKAQFGTKNPLPEPEPIFLGQQDEEMEDGWDGDDAMSLAVSFDGQQLATGQVDGEVCLFNFHSRELLATFQLSAPDRRKGSVRGLTFSADGKWLAARSEGRVTILDLAKKSKPARLETGDPTDMAFHPDGKRLLTGGPDHQVRVWDIATRREREQYDWKIGAIHSVAVSPDGLTAAAGGDNNRVVVWDLGG
jgi:WD40 repeat protein